MRRRTAGALCGVVATALLGALAGAAGPAVAQTPGKTRVYVVVVDGLSPDEVALMPFLSSLAASGTYYAEGRSVMVAETIPNHVAMVTGAYPDKTGIVANDFPAVPGTGAPQTAGDAYGSGDPRLLQADSLFTLVADQCPSLVTAAVTSKDYLYTVMNHDRNGDGRPDPDINFANLEDPTFIPGAGLTPDERTVAEALRVARSADPDFLFVSLGSVDRVGHVDEVGSVSSPLPTGARPALRDVQRTNTDTYLRLFVQALQAQGTWASTRLIVTADHSMNWSLPTSTVTVSDNPEIADVIDQFSVAQNGGAALFSLRDRTRPDRFELLRRLRASALATDGVDEVLYREPNPLDGGEQNWVGRVHPDWRQTGPRSGDLIVTVADGRRSSEPTSFSNPIPGNHGMPSTLRIPIIVSGGAGDVVQRRVDGPADPAQRPADSAENVDIAPTAAWLLGVAPPAAGFDGRPLTEAFRSRPAGSCAQAAGAAAPTAPPTTAPPAGAPPTTAPPTTAPRAAAGPGAPVGARLPATGPALLLPLAGTALLAAAAAARRRR